MINNVKAANMEKEFKKIRKFIESLAIKQSINYFNNLHYRL